MEGVQSALRRLDEAAGRAAVNHVVRAKLALTLGEVAQETRRRVDKLHLDHRQPLRFEEFAQRLIKAMRSPALDTEFERLKTTQSDAATTRTLSNRLFIAAGVALGVTVIVASGGLGALAVLGCVGGTVLCGAAALERRTTADHIFHTAGSYRTLLGFSLAKAVSQRARDLTERSAEELKSAEQSVGEGEDVHLVRSAYREVSFDKGVAEHDLVLALAVSVDDATLINDLTTRMLGKQVRESMKLSMEDPALQAYVARSPALGVESSPPLSTF